MSATVAFLVVPLFLALVGRIIYTKRVFSRLRSRCFKADQPEQIAPSAQPEASAREIDVTFDPHAYSRTALVLLLTTYTQLCTVAFRYLKCVNVASRWSVMYFMPSVLCSDASYIDGRIGVAFLLVYLAVLPVALVIVGYRSRSSDAEQDPRAGDDDTGSEMHGMQVSLLVVIRDSRLCVLMARRIAVLLAHCFEQSYSSELERPFLEHDADSVVTPGSAAR